MLPNLTGADYQALSSRWIDMESATKAGIQRLDNLSARDMVGGDKKKDLTGLWIPYYEPGNCVVIGGRMRRDHPEVKIKPDGSRKEDNKYINAPGFRRIYVPQGVTRAQMADTAIPIIICEGEFKALAAQRLAYYLTTAPRMVPIGLAGAWNFQGKIGTVSDSSGERVDEKGILPDFHLFQWIGRKCILAYDRDVKVNSLIKSARNTLRKYLLHMGAAVADLDWPLTVTKANNYTGESLGAPRPITSKGLDDWLARDGPEIVLKAIAEVAYIDGEDWRSKLLTRETGQPKPLVHNALVALEESPEWANVIEWDVFGQSLSCSRRPWSSHQGPWETTDSTRLAAWLQAKGIEVSVDTAKVSVRAAARETDPLKAYVEALAWDGIPRLDTWLFDYMAVKRLNPEGVDITNYVCAVGAAWLIGGISRAMVPGSQMDYTLVFCGKEGLRKSTAIKTMANGWFTDSIDDVHGDEPMRKLQGIWIVEFGEIEAWKKAEATSLRNFLSRRDDKYRALFEDNVKPHPRRCIFAGTTNPTWFLDTDSENRRYWPVTSAGACDVAGLLLVRDQLWAEAKARWEDGAVPYIQDESVMQMALDVRGAYAKIDDPWHEFIWEWLQEQSGEMSVAINDILKEAIGMDRAKMGKLDSQKVANSLKRLGYEQFQAGKGRVSRWRRADG